EILLYCIENETPRKRPYFGSPEEALLIYPLDRLRRLLELPELDWQEVEGLIVEVNRIWIDIGSKRRLKTDTENQIARVEYIDDTKNTIFSSPVKEGEDEAKARSRIADSFNNTTNKKTSSSPIELGFNPKRFSKDEWKRKSEKLLPKAKIGINAFIQAQYDEGKYVDDIYKKAMTNTYRNLEKWLTSEAIYKLSKGTLKRLLEAIKSGEWAALVEAFRGNIVFGTAGIRGLSARNMEELLKLKNEGPSAEIIKGPNTINDIVFMLYSVGVARYAIDKGIDTVMIGYDSRIAGKEFAEMIAETILGQSTTNHRFKIKLFDEASPFPEENFGITTKEGRSGLGILISASHNPNVYNGYKITNNTGSQLLDEERNEILEYIERAELDQIKLMPLEEAAKNDQLIWIGGAEALPDTKMDYKGVDVSGKNLVNLHAAYNKHLANFVHIDPEVAEVLKIGFAAYNGSGYAAVPRVLAALGFTQVQAITKLQELNGLFPAFGQGEQPDPGDPIAADVAIKEFISEYGQEAFDNLDVLLGTDPDADRVGITTRVPQGQQYLFGKYRLMIANDAWALLLHHNLSKARKAGTLDPERSFFVTSHVTSDGIAAVGELFGVKALGQMLDATLTEERGDYLNGIRCWVGMSKIAEFGIKMLEQGWTNYGIKEESNGYSTLGKKGKAGEIIGEGGHVRDKDGPFAGLLLTELAAIAKNKGSGLFEELDKVYIEVERHYGTANKPLPRVGAFPGAEGLSQKINLLRQAQDWMNKANSMAQTNNPFILAGQKVIGAVEFKTGKYDSQHYDGFPDEGIRFFFEDTGLQEGEPFTNSKNYITIRPSGTSQTLRFYTQLTSKVDNENIGIEKYKNYVKAEIISLLSQHQLLRDTGIDDYFEMVEKQVLTLLEKVAETKSQAEGEFGHGSQEVNEIAEFERNLQSIASTASSAITANLITDSINSSSPVGKAVEWSKVLTYFGDAVGKEQEQIIRANFFREIAFDGIKGRLGWFNPPSWDDIEGNLIEFLKIAKDKENFIFIGMGGSINTVKALIEIFKGSAPYKVFALDHLDNAALAEILKQINLKKTLVISISKSATTKETHVLSNNLKEVFKGQHLDYKDHYLWLIDEGGDKKLDERGWQEVSNFPIQPDRRTDIGGRFTAPHTLIFFLPLIILFNKDMEYLKDLYSAYLKIIDSLREEATRQAERLFKDKAQYFAVEVDPRLKVALLTWITQLFQESLGSKVEGFNPKTLVVSSQQDAPNYFTQLKAPNSIDMVFSMMQITYFLEVFVAALSYYYKLNFVTQPEVEIYKKKMRELEDAQIPEAKEVSVKGFIDQIKESLKPEYKFIEVVLYAHKSQEEIDSLQHSLQKHFTQKVLVFIGSDWNHHSYQATPNNTDTLFVILTQKEFLTQIEGISQATLEQNITDLRVITYATYQTLKDKALYLALKQGQPSASSTSSSPIKENMTTQQAITSLVQYRDNQYMSAVGATGTAAIITPSEALFVPGHDAFEAMRQAAKALIAVNIISYSQIAGHLLAAKDQGAGIILEVARSQLDYALDEDKVIKYIREVVQTTGCNVPIIVHGDHIQYNQGKVIEDYKKERQAITDICERLIKAGFTSIAIDASTIFDEVAGDIVLNHYAQNGTAEEKLVVKLEQEFALPLEWGTKFLKLDSEKDTQRFNELKEKITQDMATRKRCKDEIQTRLKELEAAFGVLMKEARKASLDPEKVIAAYDKIMLEVAQATIAGKIQDHITIPDEQKTKLLPTNNVQETTHQLKMIQSLLNKYRPELLGHFGIEVEVGHVDKKVPNPRREGKMEAKMTHPLAVRVMGEYLKSQGLSFDLIATNNGSGHGTEFDKKTLTPVSQVLKISPFLTEELQEEAERFNASIAQHGTSGSDMAELAELSQKGVIKFNIATNYQQIILNVLSLLDAGLQTDKLLRRCESDIDALIEGLHKDTREKMMQMAARIKQDPSKAEIKEDDSLFMQFIKRTYLWGTKKGKIKDTSSKEDIAKVFAKEFKRVFKEMDKALYRLGGKEREDKTTSSPIEIYEGDVVYKKNGVSGKDSNQNKTEDSNNSSDLLSLSSPLDESISSSEILLYCIENETPRKRPYFGSPEEALLIYPLDRLRRLL
ncbi:class II fructose-bisphosphate aldolase, partial [bacterium]|nr:class II fructose-bisphosphate aldolase [bacterium]